MSIELPGYFKHFIKHSCIYYGYYTILKGLSNLIIDYV